MEITIREKSEKIDELEKILTGNYPNKEVQFCCKECDKRFSSKNYLTSHRKISHPKDYKCKICEETFFDSWKLELHSKSHENIHPFRCGICDKQDFVTSLIMGRNVLMKKLGANSNMKYQKTANLTKIVL